ncbi:metallophosphoesterase [Bacillus sp. T33-2]|uniref:metallophosphoesterase n=1 Tax=Bacillus sp. T33-2 TaxID=2054168 RepID=UPI000C760902|nr:metallophosphoesterase [Bacillus sp. T33-2]PLR98065.1 YfcE family phosphodiesterase [Bacillus sp. T33-2]
MAKILIVSDSHGSAGILGKLKARHRQEVDLMIHCGDSELEADDLAISHYTAVRGNCDFHPGFLEEAVEEVNGHRILITHGHRYNVKASLLSLSYRAEEVKADIVCFGHSHQLGAELIKGVLFINPGSILLPRGRRERTYVILELTENHAYIRVFDYDRGELEELNMSFPLLKSGDSDYNI